MIYCEKYCECNTFFFTLPRFRNHIFFPPFSAMPLPQLLQIFFFFFSISAMALSQLVCQIFFSFFLFTSGTPRTGSRIGHRKFGIPVAEIQHFLSPPFSSSLSYFWLNFDNDNTEIQSLSSKSQITLNSSYNAN